MSTLYTFRLNARDAQQLAKDMDAAGYTDRTAYIKRKLFGPPGERREFATQLEVIDEQLIGLSRQLSLLASRYDIEALFRRHVAQPASRPVLPDQIDRSEFDAAMISIGLNDRTRDLVLELLDQWEVPTPISRVHAGALVNAARARSLDLATIGVMIEILQEIGAMPRPESLLQKAGR